MKVCIVGASGKLGQYMVEHCVARGWEVVGVCRPKSVPKLARFADQITVVPGFTDDESVISRAVAGCDGVLTVLAPWGVRDYSSGTARAVLTQAPNARHVFSCGWHITRDGKDQYSLLFRVFLATFGFLARLVRFADLNDQVRATDLIFASQARWTVVRGSNLEEGPSQGLPIWAHHVQDPALARNLMRRVDFAHFMVHALDNDGLVRKAPAISAPVGAGEPRPSATGAVP